MRQGRRIIIIAFSVVVAVIAFGCAVTQVIVPDERDGVIGVESRAGQTALRAARRCLDNPLQRLSIQAMRLDSFAVDLDGSAVAEPAPDRDRPQARAVSALVSANESGPRFKARVTAYTLYAIPVTQIAVSDSTETMPGNCAHVSED